MLNPEKISHQQLVHLPTSTVYCNHFTLGNPKIIFNSIIHTYFRLFTLYQKKKNRYSLTHHNWKMSLHYLIKCTTFSSDWTQWRYVIFLQTLVALKKANCGLVLVGLKKKQLWCVANGMSGKQRYSKCSKWPPSAQTHASCLFRHWSTVSCTTLCWNSAHVITRRFRNSSVWRIGTRYA